MGAVSAALLWIYSPVCSTLKSSQLLPRLWLALMLSRVCREVCVLIWQRKPLPERVAGCWMSVLKWRLELWRRSLGWDVAANSWIVLNCQRPSVREAHTLLSWALAVPVGRFLKKNCHQLGIQKKNDCSKMTVQKSKFSLYHGGDTPLLTSLPLCAQTEQGFCALDSSHLAWETAQHLQILERLILWCFNVAFILPLLNRALCSPGS